MRRIQWLMVAFLAALAVMAWVKAGPSTIRDTPHPRATTPVAMPSVATRAPETASPVATALPPEVDATLALIAAGGPFPYERDGVVFSNFEHRLPEHERGWYHEYTVPTPGLDHRGPRRIVTGGNPPSEWWYTEDHYGSFRRVEGRR